MKDAELVLYASDVLAAFESLAPSSGNEGKSPLPPAIARFARDLHDAGVRR
jgi:hypothetical protein